LSIGLQSIHENELKILGRIHTYQDFLTSYTNARDVGFSNINVDLMYGIPDQTKKSFTDTIESVVSLDPDHLSVYGLILEKGTPLFRMVNKLSLPSEDDECDMYYDAANILGSRGYEHYEVSNYAKGGKRCRHNLKYWHLHEYIGVGVAAHSYYNNTRFENCADPYEYISDSMESYIKTSYESAMDKAYEYVMLGLRTSDGISLSAYKNEFACDFLDGRHEKIDMYQRLGLLNACDDRIVLTEKGFYVSNAILTELL
jgi:oxygen-independent coproporphyrinogen-3 oxidase